MYGLVLEGGGARGAYHVGAYKALKELNIEIGGISGTSIGALNGALMVQGDDKILEDIWYKTNSSDLFDIDESAIINLKTFNLQEINLPYLLNISKEILNNRGLDTSKIRALLETYINEDKIRISDKDFGIVTYNLTDKKPMELLKEEIPYGRLIDFLIASANLPAFKIEEMDGKKYLDGGFYDNLPIGVLAKKGYTDFIAVRTLAIGIVKKVKLKNIKVTYIQPVESLGGVIGALDFNRERSEEFINLGYYDTMKVFKKLKGYKYYCYPYKGNFIEFMSEFIILKKGRIRNIGIILGYEDLPVERMLFEKIMPRLENILEMKENNDYQDIIIRLVEQIADKYEDIERFKIYNMLEFLNLVVCKFKECPLKYTKNVPAFIKHNKILSLAVKESLIIEIFAKLFI
ncbi:patatin-like phospholipase family protein [Sedimentibacter sp. MB31-C6]|uniref:patatin-like phospholipase family protein n=1 Tax=Sedimentibacter sp. MB31-C6 TaxID=3109366 RepID=UPI002DDD97E2|nr:patatin-like phospholipase family protein [Sedimentibacter sp. MB36-C1]WSI03829.1 patatin-like phospholipase family protein [Sedimentibacter sp. MB36-C1]